MQKKNRGRWTLHANRMDYRLCCLGLVTTVISVATGIPVAATFPTHTAPISLHNALRQRMIDRHNGLPNATWRAAHNARFDGLPIGTAKHLCGVKHGSVERLREAVRSGRVRNLSSASLIGEALIPEVFDAATRWPACAMIINDIRDQSACGCCWYALPSRRRAMLQPSAMQCVHRSGRGGSVVAVRHLDRLGWPLRYGIICC